jgi:hypothetical protein
MKARFKAVLIFTLALSLNLTPVAASISHIHNVEVFGKKILLGAHEGLFEHKSATETKQIGAIDFDFMGLASFGSKLYASGHPGKVSKALNPLGLITSTNGGKSWQQVSLAGEVDFHMLEVGRFDIYGVDAGSNQLFYSQNLGKTWKILGVNSYSDIAILDNKKRDLFAIKAGSLLLASAGFSKVKKVSSKLEFSSIESLGSKLYASSEKDLYQLTSSGEKIVKLYSFPYPILGISANKSQIVVVTSKTLYISKDGAVSFRS